jgi:hypothetical protein
LHLNIPGPKIKGGPQRPFAMPFGWIFQLSKRQNAETAWQNSLVDLFVDFGPGKLKRSLLW